MLYRFKWDPDKAKNNIEKHGISFEMASTVFRDPMALSIYDEDHSIEEDRWITLGIGYSGVLLVVNHTFQKFEQDTVLLRIISCRRATKKEQKQYNE